MRKKMLRYTVLMAMCISLGGVGMSLAYNTDQDAAANQFSFVGDPGLDARLSEPSWKPENGLLIVPNAVIPKDPQVTNTSSADLDELVAVQLEFRYTSNCPVPGKAGSVLSDADMAYVNAVYEIDYNADLSGDWVRFEQDTLEDAIQRFYYKNVLERNFPGDGETTTPLFTRMSVDPMIGNELYSHVQKMGGFDIIIRGIALQHMPMETEFGLDSAKDAYEAGLFQFDTIK